MTRPPRFWHRPPDRPGLRAQALAPLAAVYAAGTARRVARAGTRVGVPVICAGNLNAGGTGKTPTVIALLERLRPRIVHVVSRGYGGQAEGPLRVDPARHDAAEVGDEPLLLAAFAAVWVSRDRAAGARAAVAAGAEAVILDDGMQSPALARDLTILVVDAAAGFGNGRVIPAGPLREPVASGMARADLCLTIGPPAAQAEFGRIWGPQVVVPRLRGVLDPLPTGMPWAGLRCLAFAGIGRPEKFFATLEGLGAEILRRVPLGDHQPLGAPLLARMEREAAALGAQLVTTEKDAVRLPPETRHKVLTLPVRLAFSDATPLDDRLAALGLQPSALESRSSSSSDIAS